MDAGRLGCHGRRALTLGLATAVLLLWAEAGGRPHRRRAPTAAPTAASAPPAAAPTSSPAPPQPTAPTSSPAPPQPAAPPAARAPAPPAAQEPDGEGALTPQPLDDPLWPLPPAASSPVQGPPRPAAEPQPPPQPLSDVPGPVPPPADRESPSLLPLRQRVARYDHYRLRTPLHLPFRGAWTAYNASPGGRNTHFLNANQRYAVDWLMTRPASDGRRRTCRGRCRDNGDFFAYGQEVLAPADGRVVHVIDGVPDNRPGQVDVYFRLGNTIILALGGGEYLYLSHLQPGSLAVRPGDSVRRGQRLGRCGNSGNSSEPHLHMQVGDSPLISQSATMPLLFQRVLRNGEAAEEAIPQSGEEFAPPP